MSWWNQSQCTPIQSFDASKNNLLPYVSFYHETLDLKQCNSSLIVTYQMGNRMRCLILYIKWRYDSYSIGLKHQSFLFFDIRRNCFCVRFWRKIRFFPRKEMVFSSWNKRKQLWTRENLYSLAEKELEEALEEGQNFQSRNSNPNFGSNNRNFKLGTQTLSSYRNAISEKGVGHAKCSSTSSWTDSGT